MWTGAFMRRNPHNTFRGSGKPGRKRNRPAYGKNSYMERDRKVTKRLEG